MADMELTLAITPYDRVQPLLAGEVKPRGIELRCHPIPLHEIWTAQLRHSRYDVSEMSFGFFLRARALGWGYRMLPVFHNRNFNYTRILVRAASGIRSDHPQDLNGKRIGLTEYGMSAAVWTRGILQSEHGVRVQGIEWFQERTETFIPGQKEGFKPPSGVRLHQASADLGAMLLHGELDAAFTLGSSLTRAPLGELADPSKFRPLFSDAQKEAIRYYTKTGIYPPHHVTIVRESVLREHPWVAESLMEAFEQSRKMALKRLYDTHTSSLLIFGEEWLGEQRAVFGEDPYPDGLTSNIEAVQLFQTFSHEQGLTQGAQPWEELFPEALLAGTRG